MNKVVRALARDLREALPAFVFLFVAFHMVAVTRAVSLAEFRITGAGAAFATVGALIVAKAMILLRRRAVARLFGGRRIWNILWRTVLFGAVATLFRIAEELIRLAAKHGGLVESLKHLASGVSWPHFCVVQMWLLSLLFLYELASDLAHEIGLSRVREILLQPRV